MVSSDAGLEQLQLNTHLICCFSEPQGCLCIGSHILSNGVLGCLDELPSKGCILMEASSSPVVGMCH